MSDASKRLHDAVDDVVADSVTQVAETNPTLQAVPKMNRVRKALRDADDDGCASSVSWGSSADHGLSCCTGSCKSQHFVARGAKALPEHPIGRDSSCTK